MMLPEKDQETLDRLICGGLQLDAALAGLLEEQLDLRLAPGEWSIRQIVHHLVDGGDVFTQIIRQAIAQTGSDVVFAAYPGNEAWAAELDYHCRPVGPALGLIKAHCAYQAELLNHFYGAWDREVVIHDAQGTHAQPISVRQVVDMLGEHMAEHVETIRAIRAANGL
jgi:hypothetical protein